MAMSVAVLGRVSRNTQDNTHLGMTFRADCLLKSRTAPTTKMALWPDVVQIFLWTGRSDSPRCQQKEAESKCVHAGVFMLRVLPVHSCYKAPLRDGVDLISRGHRKSKRGNTGVPKISMSYLAAARLRIDTHWYEVRRCV